jgi:hypothetical protein
VTGLLAQRRIAVITPVAGRAAHLRVQEEGLARGTRRPDIRIVAAMGEPPLVGSGVQVVQVPVRSRQLPLAKARNRGAQAALAAGAQILIFLDVDCIPGDSLVARYGRAASDESGLCCGPVAYLPAAPPGGYDLKQIAARASAHPARPVPPDDTVYPRGDHRLFWSLSFALTATNWRRVGGFDEEYIGYGAEDTDYGQKAAAIGLDLTWIGGAWAYHQYHPTQDPPVQHLSAILRNATLFRQRWGWWPMQGWLTEFDRLGLARFDPERQKWIATRPNTRTRTLNGTPRRNSQ